MGKLGGGGGVIILRRTEKEQFWFTNEVQRSLWTEAVFQDSSLSKMLFSFLPLESSCGQFGAFLYTVLEIKSF